mmetsp:Transcript_31655/g.84282  ORF Transcript_31655/g.84282 Transcript_31655/m.84282 type:complete len:442 (+) Transcript_31655:286-1611(+)
MRSSCECATRISFSSAWRWRSASSCCICTSMMRSNSSRSNFACSPSLRSFSFCCLCRATISSLLISSWCVFSRDSLCLAARSAASLARLARRASISEALSWAFSCMARSLAVSFSFSAAMYAFSASSSLSRASLFSRYSMIFCSSSFSESILSSLICIADVLALFTSFMSRSAAKCFCRCCSISSAFSASICFRMKARSWSRCSSSFMRWAWRSLICSMMTLAPLRWLSRRSFSRTSYICRAFRRSISIMASSCLSSSSFSACTTRFSCSCASRMVTTLEYSIIWFMCLTSSMSSSSICFARSKTLFFCPGLPSFSSPPIIMFFLRSSSIWRIFSLRAWDFANLSCKASSWRHLCSISSSLVIRVAASLSRFSSEAGITTASCLAPPWPAPAPRNLLRTITVSLPTMIISLPLSLARFVLFFAPPLPNNVSSMSALWFTVR